MTESKPDSTMIRIGEGIELNHRGERAAARELFAQVWHEVGEDGDPLHRCALAHSMADVQDDVREGNCTGTCALWRLLMDSPTREPLRRA